MTPASECSCRVVRKCKKGQLASLANTKKNSHIIQIYNMFVTIVFVMAISYRIFTRMLMIDARACAVLGSLYSLEKKLTPDCPCIIRTLTWVIIVL